MDFKETSWNYISDDNIAYFSSSERKWITKIRKLAEANPNEVKIVREPEDNGGTIYAQAQTSKHDRRTKSCRSRKIEECAQ